MARSTRILLIAAGLFLAACAAYVALLAWLDGDRIRTVVSDRLAERHGVALSIENLQRSYSLWPQIRIEKMQVANARRSDHPLIQVDSASFRIHPWSLLIGPLTLDELVVDGVRISVPVDDEGARYWDPLVNAISQWLHRFDWSLPQFSVRNLHTDRRHVRRGNELLVSADRIDGAMPRLADLTIAATGVNANLDTTLPLRLHGTARIESMSLRRQDGDLPVTLVAKGYIGNKVLKIAAEGGNLLAGDPLERDPLRATIEVGAAVAELQGTMSRDDPMHLALSVAFDKPGKEDEPDLHVEAAISDPGISWRMTGIRATQGDSTLTGTLEIENERGRRYFGGTLTVSNVQLPDAGEDDAEGDKGLKDVLPSGDVYSHLLKFTEEFDADFTLNATGSRLLGVPFKQITLHTTLDRGALLASIEDSKIRDTSLQGSFSVTPGEGETTLSLDATIRDVELSALVGGIEKLKGVTGRFDGDLRLQAGGNDTASVLGSTSGRMTLYLDDGAMPDELATRIAGDVFTAMFADFEADDKTPIRCAIVDFSVEQGVANSQRMMMDTGEFRMFGSGRIELGKGLVDIELIPRAKDFSLVSMRLPLRVHGPLDDLKLNPDVSEGVASLLTPIEFGDRDEADCTPPRVAATEPRVERR